MLKNNLLFRILLISLTLLFSMGLLLFIVREWLHHASVLSRLLYYPRAETGYPDVPGGVPVELDFKGRTIYGLFSGQGKKLVVIFHGNGSIMNDFDFLAIRFNENGFSTLLVEYPGYGLDYGKKTTEKTVYENASLLISHVAERYSFQREDISLFGISLGTGVAVEMARKNLGLKLVLVTPFTSVPDVAHEKVIPVLPWWIMKDRYNSFGKAGKLDNPALIIHGTIDSTIPYRQGKTLSQRFRNGRLITITGAGHNDIFQYIDDKIFEEIDDFLLNN